MDSNSNDHLPPFSVRPYFIVRTSDNVESLAQKIKDALSSEGVNCKGWVDQEYASLYLPEELQHFWSPHLSLTFDTQEEGSILRGRYGPKPTVWTMFLFIYAIIGFALLIISIIGLSNYSLDRSAAILWWIPVLLFLFLSLYLVAFFGQKLGHDQMLILHQFTENAIGVTIDGEEK
jgi:hypothetical protein